jgi:hypothetical protein
MKNGWMIRAGNAKPGRTANTIAMIRKFHDDIQPGARIESWMCWHHRTGWG